MKRLVRGRYKESEDGLTYGICPHCLKEINSVGLTRCGLCNGEIVWRGYCLDTAEKEADNKAWIENRQNIVDRTGIKPCPFCGDVIGFPRAKSDEKGFYLEIGCWNCGIYFQDVPTQRDIKSVNKCSDELIELWNTRN